MTTKRVLVTLPYPPLLNHMYVKTRRGVRLSDAAKTYRIEVGYICFNIPMRQVFLDGCVAVEMHVYRPRKRGDIDATQKAVFDALNGWLWKDDQQIIEMHVYRHDDKKNPRVELTISEAKAA